ncbi:MAG TPA: hypothetical protein VFH54_12760 [Mycobacteriales bacterium]|nr:hypothetical protein [Mycobacteriales bacterium]
MTEWTSPGNEPPPAERAGAAWAEPAQAWGPPPPGWHAPYAAPPPPRPGIIPLRPLGVGELLDGAFTAMRRYPRATLGLSAAVATVQQLVNLLIDLASNNIAAPGAGFSALGSVSGVLTAVINALLGFVLLGMLSLVIGDAVIGRNVDLGDVWSRLRPLLLPLIGAAFLAAVLPWLGLIGLIVGGVFLWVALSFTTPALVLERLSIGQALKRSWRLAVPAFWRVLGIRLLAFLIAAVIATILSLPGLLVAVSSFTNSIANGNDIHLSIGAEIAVRLSSLVASTVSAPITAGVVALLYIDRRMRAEALDVTLTRAAAPPSA